jgi:integrase
MSVYQVGEIWRYRFMLNGRRYFATLPDVKTKTKAKAEEDAHKVRIREGREGLPNCGTNFERFVREEFLPHIEAHRTTATYQSYKWRCDGLIKEFGHLDLTEITTFSVERFKRDQMKRETKRGKEQSPASINRYGQILSSIYTRAERLKLIEAGSRPDIELFKERVGRIRYLSVDEERKLLEAAKFWPHLKDLIVIYLATGMRKDELLRLEKAAVDFDLNVISVMGKGGKRRRIPLDPEGEARRVIQRRCNESPTKWIFTSPHGGGRLTKVDRSLASACEDAGIDPPITLHILRHTFCTRLAASGVDIRTIQELAVDDHQKTYKSGRR